MARPSNAALLLANMNIQPVDEEHKQDAQRDSFDEEVRRVDAKNSVDVRGDTLPEKKNSIGNVLQSIEHPAVANSSRS